MALAWRGVVDSDSCSGGTESAGDGDSDALPLRCTSDARV